MRKLSTMAQRALSARARGAQVMNADRASWAKTAAEHFRTLICATDQCDVVPDLICDLLHLCDSDPKTYGTAEAALRRGQANYEAEKQEEVDA